MITLSTEELIIIIDCVEVVKDDTNIINKDARQELEDLIAKLNRMKDE